MNKALIAVVIIGGAITLRGVHSSMEATSSVSDPPALYRSSVVGTDFDFITESDPDSFQRLEYKGFDEFEMPDKRGTEQALVQNAYIFNAYFTDGTMIGVALSKNFGSREAAEREVKRYIPRIGKLPPLYRQKIKHIVVHKGGADTTAFAEDKGNFFVIYSDNATKRIGTHDLEETFFHEGTHASIQEDYLEGAAWEKAKSLDGAYITDYAKTEDQEDFAESALFAYTIIYHPDRFPSVERDRIVKQIPNRIAFFKNLYTGREGPLK
ncbi:hypothetical protein [Sphingomonas sp. M1-B02]|uniref:hypothetical protein n=1 Tax=Sphingomonas sp. M1-B02 TaxID=3114300 RepID=UPI00223F3CE6|nr:hypothetical protein [Sphingomonas sp. S6-11]UZK67711.1 hypothetical protein OKW87_07750 [Sphingomonas sp. S6-11]